MEQSVRQRGRVTTYSFIYKQATSKVFSTATGLYLSIFNHNSLWHKASWFWLAMILSIKSCSVLAQASKITINQDLVAQPIVAAGTSGGNTPLQEIAGTENTATGYCDGYVRSQPNHTLELESFFEFLRLEVESSADTTILVKGSDGVWCNDDAGTANPVIEGQWQPGVYQVWVGSYQANAENDYQIKITGR